MEISLLGKQEGWRGREDKVNTEIYNMDENADARDFLFKKKQIYGFSIPCIGLQVRRSLYEGGFNPCKLIGFPRSDWSQGEQGIAVEEII